MVERFTPQKQGRGTGNLKDARRCAVYNTPWANFQFSEKVRVKRIEGVAEVRRRRYNRAPALPQRRNPFNSGMNLSTSCSFTVHVYHTFWRFPGTLTETVRKWSRESLTTAAEGKLEMSGPSEESLHSILAPEH